MSVEAITSSQAHAEFRAPRHLEVVQPAAPQVTEDNIIPFPSPAEPLSNGPRIDEFYTHIYEQNTEHSPEASTVSLARRAMPYIRELQDGVVAEIGAGRQNFPAYLKRTYYRKTKRKDLPVNFMTVDIASMRSDQLSFGTGLIPPTDPEDPIIDYRPEKTIDNPHALHVRADGTSLPIARESISLVVSNMAYDFMPADAVRELHDILKPGGRAFMNLSYPALNKDMDIEKQLKSNTIKPSRKRELLFWKNYLANNDILVSSPEEAVALYESYGFIIKRSAQVENSLYDWLELDLYKPTKAELEEIKKQKEVVVLAERQGHTFYEKDN